MRHGRPNVFKLAIIQSNTGMELMEDSEYVTIHFDDMACDITFAHTDMTIREAMTAANFVVGTFPQNNNDTLLAYLRYPSCDSIDNDICMDKTMDANGLATGAHLSSKRLEKYRCNTGEIAVTDILDAYSRGLYYLIDHGDQVELVWDCDDEIVDLMYIDVDDIRFRSCTHTLPSSFGVLRASGELDISNNRIILLPESFGNLQVGYLDISGNSRFSLPESFGNLQVHGDFMGATHLNLGDNQLRTLPGSFGNLQVQGNLNLGNNKLGILPGSFGNLQVGGDLNLAKNQLTTLPESFGNLQIGGYLVIGHNQLTILPSSFGNVRVGACKGIDLTDNQLASLPESFGNLQVGGNLVLAHNKLATLPETFGNLQVGGILCIWGNRLMTLPESFGNLQVGGDLDLSHNLLVSLPESFGNLQVGGNLNLSGNRKLVSLPESFGNLQVGGDRSRLTVLFSRGTKRRPTDSVQNTESEQKAMAQRSVYEFDSDDDYNDDMPLAKLRQKVLDRCVVRNR